ncbi:MAG: putative ABC transporter permease [Clostridia bacterium]|nr:putative ABC transporter permease [Clostridia bacterium]
MNSTSLVEINKLSQKQKMVLYFFIYAILGWILETIYCVVTLGVFNKRGFLYGPVCPIYGFGAIILIQSLKSIKTNTTGKFFISLVAFTVFEYVVSAVLEELFGLRWWDYTNEALNFQGRISLPFSIAWGIIGVIFVEKIHPFVKAKVERYIILIPRKKIINTLYIFTIIILSDLILSVIKYINL